MQVNNSIIRLSLFILLSTFLGACSMERPQSSESYQANPSTPLRVEPSAPPPSASTSPSTPTSNIPVSTTAPNSEGLAFVSAVSSRNGPLSQDEILECRQSWNRWKNLYSAANPYASQNKNTDWPLTVEEVQQIWSSDDLVLSEPVFKGPSLEMVRSIPKTSLRVIFDLMNHYLNPRDREIVQNIHSLIQSVRNPRNTLVILHMGLVHAMDYFRYFPDERIHYASMPLHRTSQLYSPASERFVRRYLEEGGASFSLMAEYDSIFFTPDYWDAQRFSYDRKKGSLNKVGFHLAYRPLNTHDQSREQALRTMLTATFPEDSNIVLIGESHITNEVDNIRLLPSGRCLRSLGFQSVVVGQEGFVGSETIESYEELRLRGRSSLEDFRRQLRSRSPELYQLMTANEVVIRPGVSALQEKIEEYSRHVNVSVRGIDSNENSSFSLAFSDDFE